jgi:hypothetical protein
MSWIEENPLAMKGLGLATEMVRKATGMIADEQLDEESMVAISIQIDYLLMALTGLSEANTSSGLDDELLELLQQQGE